MVFCKNILDSKFVIIVDPYVKIAIYNGKRKIKKKKTAVQRRTVNPYFNERFTFEKMDQKLIKVVSVSSRFL